MSPNQNLDMPYCPQYRLNTCCSSAGARWLVQNYPFTRAEGSTSHLNQLSSQCSDILDARACVSCHPDVGVRWGRNHSLSSGRLVQGRWERQIDICQSYYEDAYAKCQWDKFTVLSFPNIDGHTGEVVDASRNSSIAAESCRYVAPDIVRGTLGRTLFGSAEAMYYQFFQQEVFACLDAARYEGDLTLKGRSLLWDNLPTSDCWSAGSCLRWTASSLLLWIGALLLL